MNDTRASAFTLLTGSATTFLVLNFALFTGRADVKKTFKNRKRDIDLVEACLCHLSIWLIWVTLDWMLVSGSEDPKNWKQNRTEKHVSLGRFGHLWPLLYDALTHCGHRIRVHWMSTQTLHSIIFHFFAKFCRPINQPRQAFQRTTGTTSIDDQLNLAKWDSLLILSTVSVIGACRRRHSIAKSRNGRTHRMTTWSVPIDVWTIK